MASKREIQRDIRAARKQIQRELTDCYQGEARAGYLKGTLLFQVACQMTREPGAQIDLGHDEQTSNGTVYQYFYPKQDTFKYKGFRWNKNPAK